MLKMCIESGVDTIVATPHLYPGAYMAPTAYRDEMLVELRDTVKQRQLPIEIVSGRECYLSPEIYDREKELGKLTINDNGKYLLIEFPMQEIPEYVKQMIFDIQVQGITPIIAHPERYHDIIENPNLTHEFIHMGCLMQVNVGSLFGTYGKHIQQTAAILLKSQMAHIVASDMHTQYSMPLGKGFDKLAKLVGRDEALRLIEERPRAVIQNHPVHYPDPLVYCPKKSFANLWGLFSKPSLSAQDNS
jgi:protein-tyrosine phosphatase